MLPDSQKPDVLLPGGGQPDIQAPLGYSYDLETRQAWGNELPKQALRIAEAPPENEMDVEQWETAAVMNNNQWSSRGIDL